MRTIAVALGAIATVVATTAIAQDNSYRVYPYDSDWAARERAREAYRNGENRWREDRRDERFRENRHYECWNPRARTFEEVREGEYQDDLDRSRCRATSDGYRNYRYR